MSKVRARREKRLVVRVEEEEEEEEEEGGSGGGGELLFMCEGALLFVRAVVWRRCHDAPTIICASASVPTFSSWYV